MSEVSTPGSYRFGNLARAVNPRLALEATSSILANIAGRRPLLTEMVKRELTEQHAGQFLGSVWAIAHPLFLMGVYLFLFAVVFGARIGGTREMPYDYPTYILSGLIPWLALQSAATKSVASITSNEKLVTQVVFPLEILPLKCVLASLVGQAVSLVALVVYVTTTAGSVHLSYVLLPILIGIQLMLMFGIGLILSATAVFLRDIREVTQMAVTVGIFLLPVVYLPEWTPEAFRPVLDWNPLSHLIWVYQDALYFGRMAHPISWIVFPVFSVVTLIGGSRLFQWSRQMFGDAL